MVKSLSSPIESRLKVEIKPLSKLATDIKVVGRKNAFWFNKSKTKYKKIESRKQLAKYIEYNLQITTLPFFLLFLGKIGVYA